MKGLLSLSFGIASSLFGTTIDLGTLAIDPRSNILFANMVASHPDNPHGPVFIDLNQIAQANGLGNSLAGYRLAMRASGNMCYIQLTSGCPSVQTLGFLGAFDTDNIVMPGAANPLPGAIATSSPVVTQYPGTYYDQLSTSNGPPDFLISNAVFTSVLVPGSTRYLAIGLFDSFFGDNSGTSTLDLRLELPDVLVPEPAPALLTLLGLSLLGLGRKIVRSGNVKCYVNHLPGA